MLAILSKMPSNISRATLLVVLAAGPLSAEVVRIEVTSRADLAGAQGFGAAGPYEKLFGKIFFAVDPALPANRIVTDLDKAPRNAEGRVEFSSDFFLIKPKQIERGNGAVLYEVSNRGGKGMLGFFNHASGSPDPASAAEMGDGFLMRQGFTLLWVGWQFDVPQRPGLLRVYTPIATENGRPIRGRVRSDFVPTERESDHSLADRNHTAYAVVDPNAPDNVMTVRDSVEAPRRTIPRGQWGFARDEAGTRVADSTRVYMAAKFEPGKIYEVVYTAANPPIAGLGPAAIRDTISMLKYKSADSWSMPAGAITRATAFGVSQSGRFLRKYLYDGFNRDEGNRKVFDGVIAHVAGAGRGSFNHRFAQPSRDGHPYLNFFYPTDIFPFTDVAQKDPETGVTDGLLTHPGAPELLPKIFYTNSDYEYWGRAASLVHTTVDGTGDAPLMDNVRIYLLTAGQHGPGAFPPTQTIGQQLSNPLDYRWAMKALLVAMDRWTANGTAPPPSRYPRIADNTLVSRDRLRFPKVPGITTPDATHRAYRVDYGPRFAKEGLVTQEPPKIGTAFPVLVPQVDADGNGIAGIRMPELAVPLATYTGWNLFNDRSGPPTVLSSMQGSYIPLARTSADRTRTNDPRRSIEERYRDKDHYLGLVSKAAQELIDHGLLLADDLPVVVRNAGRHWDYLVRTTSTAGAPQAAQDSKMTQTERAELVELLLESEREFMKELERLNEQQWSFKPGPDRWSVGEVVEHVVLADALLFETATKSLTRQPDVEWEATLSKTDTLRRALPNRTRKVDAPAAIQPRRTMTREQLLSRFMEQRARALNYARETDAPLKAHTAANPFFGSLNAHQWLLYIPLHHLRHNQQIVEVKASPGYPR